MQDPQSLNDWLRLIDQHRFHNPLTKTCYSARSNSTARTIRPPSGGAGHQPSNQATGTRSHPASHRGIQIIAIALLIKSRLPGAPIHENEATR
jgi:hypothetical protein